MSLRKATFSATRWTTAAAAIRALLHMIQVIVLARILAPHDFGLMAMAGVATAVASLFADLGLGSALMHFPRPDHRTLSTIYWLNLGVSCLLAFLFMVLSWPVAAGYGNTDLLSVLWWLGLTFPLAAIGHPFRILAEKELLFSALARQEVTAAVLGFLLAIAVALAGGGVYALVAGTLTTIAIGSLLACLFLPSGFRPDATFSLALAKPYCAFGIHRIGDGFWSTLSMQADVFIAGLNSTPAGTAFYAVPREQCLRVASTLVNPVVTRVSLPVLTRLQSDALALRSVYLKSLRMTASLNFPLYSLLILFADEVIRIVLGPQWHDAAFYLRLFALWGMVRSTGNPSGSLIYAVGMAKRAHVWNMIQFLVTAPLLLWAARRGGLQGLAVTMCSIQLVVYVLVWRFLVRPACGAGFAEYSRSFLPPLVATALASTITLLAVYPVAGRWKLPVGVVAFACTYTILTWKLNRSWLNAVVELAEPFCNKLRRFRHPLA